MSDTEILAEDGPWRVSLEPDQCADEPDDDMRSPLLRVNPGGCRGCHGNGDQAEHIAAGSRDASDDAAVEAAAHRWGGPGSPEWFKVERYLRAFHGATKIDTYWSGSYWYVTYDSERWREQTGAPKGSASLDDYRAWCEGDVWWFAVERLVTWTTDDPEAPDKSVQRWEVTETCGGIYGREPAEQEAMWFYSSHTANQVTS